MTASATELGERRHETCRYGRLTEAWAGDGASGNWKPFVTPLCCWQPPGPTPPALKRAWGGLIEVERDCADCAVHAPIEPSEGTER